MQEHFQTFTRWSRIVPSAIIAFLGTVPFQGISCVAAVMYLLTMLYHVIFISKTFHIKAMFWWIQKRATG